MAIRFTSKAASPNFAGPDALIEIAMAGIFGDLAGHQIHGRIGGLGSGVREKIERNKGGDHDGQKGRFHESDFRGRGVACVPDDSGGYESGQTEDRGRDYDCFSHRLGFLDLVHFKLLNSN